MINCLLNGSNSLLGRYIYRLFNAGNVIIRTSSKQFSRKQDSFLFDIENSADMTIRNLEVNSVIFLICHPPSYLNSQSYTELARLYKLYTKYLDIWLTRKVRLVFVSTSAVFRRTQSVDSSPMPLSKYGLFKFMLEDFINSHDSNNSVIVRLTKVMDFQSIQETFLFPTKPVKLFNDHFVAPLSASFAATIIWNAACDEESGPATVNVSGSEVVSYREMVEHMLDVRCIRSELHSESCRFTLPFYMRHSKFFLEPSKLCVSNYQQYTAFLDDI